VYSYFASILLAAFKRSAEIGKEYNGNRVFKQTDTQSEAVDLKINIHTVVINIDELHESKVPSIKHL
jgi:hypothetical protein